MFRELKQSMRYVHTSTLLYLWFTVGCSSGIILQNFPVNLLAWKKNLFYFISVLLYFHFLFLLLHVNYFKQFEYSQLAHTQARRVQCNLQCLEHSRRFKQKRTKITL